MPHFVIDCSDKVLKQKSAEEIMQRVSHSANSSSLFAPGDIKVRINPFQNYIVGGEVKDFIHVFANIMEGRTVKQKSLLSKTIVSDLKNMFPDIEVISINIRDFEKATYCNKTMV